MNVPGSSSAPAAPTRIRRASRSAALVGPEGGELGEGLSRRVRSMQRSGRPLDPAVRAPMERAFERDLGGVRVHTGSDAGHLNEAMGARAFTVGQHIFARDPIGVERPAEQRLLAHELAHTQQRGGASASAARTIRRDVGFEFEVGSWTLDYIDQATTEQTSGMAPFTDADIDNRYLDKDTVIHAGRGFNLRPDQADDGTWHIEFVIEPPVTENLLGRARLATTMNALRRFTDRLIREGASAQLTWAGRTGHYLRSGDLGCTEPWVLITPRDNMSAEPQLTAGIRLDQLASVMTKLTPGALPGESAPETASRRTGASYMGGKGDSALVGASPGQVRHLFGTFPGVTVHSPAAPSEELVAFLALVRTYLIKAGATMAYAKSLAPLMARTNFAAMFDSLPERLYYRSYPNEFVDLALYVSGLAGNGGQPFFAGGSTYSDATDWAKVQAALTRDRWLHDLTNGVDRLTIGHFPDNTVAGYLFGFGSLGTNTDTVGGSSKRTKTEAPIFEFRRMIGHVRHQVWSTMALELFDYINATNRQKDATFTGRKTDRAVARG